MATWLKQVSGSVATYTPDLVSDWVEQVTHDESTNVTTIRLVGATRADIEGQMGPGNVTGG